MVESPTLSTTTEQGESEMLTARKCQALGAGRHADDRGLYLNVTAGGSRSWVYRYSIHQRRREMGLGGYPDLSLSDARKERDKWASVLASGTDPMAARDLERLESSRTGRTVADMVASTFEARRPSLRDDGKAGRWLSPLNIHVLPTLGKRDIETVTGPDIYAALKPIWRKKPDTARKAIQRLGQVIKHAAAHGFKVDLTATEMAKQLLGEQGHKVKHLDFIPWPEVPAFYAHLKADDKKAALALRLKIFTGVRTRPLIYARAEHFDLGQAIWTIPGEGAEARMKGQKDKVDDFRIPLPKEAVNVIREALETQRGGYLFPSRSLKGKLPVIPLDSMSVYMKKLDLTAVPHGFRTSFKTWSAEHGIDDQLSEMCIAHAVGNTVSRAYRRTDQLEMRAGIMERWAQYVTGEESGEVINLFEGRA